MDLKSLSMVFYLFIYKVALSQFSYIFKNLKIEIVKIIRFRDLTFYNFKLNSKPGYAVVCRQIAMSMNV